MIGLSSLFISYIIFFPTYAHTPSKSVNEKMEILKKQAEADLQADAVGFFADFILVTGGKRIIKNEALLGGGSKALSKGLRGGAVCYLKKTAQRKHLDQTSLVGDEESGPSLVEECSNKMIIAGVGQALSALSIVVINPLTYRVTGYITRDPIMRLMIQRTIMGAGGFIAYSSQDFFTSLSSLIRSIGAEALRLNVRFFVFNTPTPITPNKVAEIIAGAEAAVVEARGQGGEVIAGAEMAVAEARGQGGEVIAGAGVAVVEAPDQGGDVKFTEASDDQNFGSPAADERIRTTPMRGWRQRVERPRAYTNHHRNTVVQRNTALQEVALENEPIQGGGVPLPPPAAEQQELLAERQDPPADEPQARPQIVIDDNQPPLSSHSSPAVVRMFKEPNKLNWQVEYMNEVGLKLSRTLNNILFASIDNAHKVIKGEKSIDEAKKEIIIQGAVDVSTFSSYVIGDGIVVLVSAEVFPGGGWYYEALKAALSSALGHMVRPWIANRTLDIMGPLGLYSVLEEQVKEEYGNELLQENERLIEYEGLLEYDD
jgi:hypothetical protein